MQISIGGITAKCFSCGNEEFVPLQPRPDARPDRLVCDCCCHEVFYDDLRSQIGRTAVAQRNVLARLTPVSTKPRLE
jgi:hypothetical protein